MLKTRLFRSFSNLAVSPEVLKAVKVGQPVVALESTIITHGLPYPQNVEMAQQVEEIVRLNGAVPATTAFFNGQPKVGLSPAELEQLASGSMGAPIKVSKRDIPYVMANNRNGGTTVASTMILASRANIPVFATGGLGGVHRKVSNTWDISADLEELGRTPVTVVCSGFKSILDIEKSVEYLETKGCLLASLNQPNIPNFFTKDSGIKAPYSVSSAEQAAKLVYMSLTAELNSGMVFCVPPPKPVAGFTNEQLELVIQAALMAADKEGIKGKEITPYLLKKVWEATEGKSIDTNIALVKNNATFAAQLAVSLATLRVPLSQNSEIGNGHTHNHSHDHSHDFSQVHDLLQDQLHDLRASHSHNHVHDHLHNQVHDHSHTAEPSSHSHKHGHDCTSCSDHSTPPAYHSNPDIICIGSLSEDLTCTLPSNAPATLEPTSYPGKIVSRAGGTAYNVALAASLYGAPTALVAKIGKLNPLVSKVKKDMNLIGIENGSSAGSRYVSVNTNKGELLAAVADMADAASVPVQLINETLTSKDPKVVVIDANLGTDQIQAVLDYKQRKLTDENSKNSIVVYEPTSVPKAVKIANMNLSCFPNQLIDIATPNQHEIMALFNAFMEKEKFDTEDWLPTVMAMPVGNAENRYKLSKFGKQFKALANMESDGTFRACFRLLPFIPNLFVTLGKDGVLVCRLMDASAVSKTDVLRAKTSATSVLFKDQEYSYAVQVDYFPALTPEMEVVSVNGAGDSFCGVIAAQLSNKPDTPVSDLVKTGMKAAELSLQTEDSVHCEVRDLHFNAQSAH